ncbi:uncharacterized protein LOC116195679 [Punica granatum]|uniref:Uncharacterized protein n=2 Tax=Punica granatum TaxID=22663 RepID=A0A218WB05_PUNGR|nr:uncharacterized protein LOC116195679 [Punica granatum]OWM69975.1 hypothetical protein CDL15_Pgr025824 [Punica granatum]PKI39590.1 hypothetical protein CRG98_040060 [Punica granatum]
MVMKVALGSFHAKQPSTRYPSSFARTSGSDKRPGSACRFARRSPPLTYCVFRNRSSNRLDRFSGCDLFQDSESVLALDGSSYDGDGIRDISSRPRFISGLPCSRSEFLSPAMLGIRPDPPDWPERTEVARISIEQRANRVEIPLSIRIIKMKQRQMEMGLILIDEAVESTNCSVRRAFSSVVLIIRELQMYAAQMMERGLDGDELKEIVGNVQREINASLVWLFRQFFCQTPTLMVYVMILLANFSIYSMVGNSAIAAPMVGLFETITEDKDQEESPGFILREESSVYTVDSEQVSLSGEEEVLWRGILEDVGKMRGEVLDEETVRGFIAPVTVQVDQEEHEEHLRTDLLYQMNLSQDPENPLLLCNYAQFLTHIFHSYDRAEECFKRATQLKQPDAEALSQYADFLYIVRKDMWGAEERYQQAITMEPNNPFYASKYASFLWSTGGEETCFPIDPTDDSLSATKLSSTDEYS